MVSSRKLAIWGYAGAGAAGALAIVIGGIVFIASRVDPHAPQRAWTMTAAYVAAVAWAAVFTTLYWRRLDEAAKEAQKFAWFFGSIGAMALSAPVIVFWRLSGAAFLAQVFGRAATPGAFFAMGWVSLALLQTVGFLFVWIGWWRVRR
ncbi:MAG: hypothetical protein ACHP84_07280 [Caulobacterales bacterium]